MLTVTGEEVDVEAEGSAENQMDVSFLGEGLLDEGIGNLPEDEYMVKLLKL